MPFKPTKKSSAKQVAALRKEVADAASLEEVAALLEEVAAIRAQLLSRFYDPTPRQQVAAPLTALGKMNAILRKENAALREIIEDIKNPPLGTT